MMDLSSQHVFLAKVINDESEPLLHSIWATAATRQHDRYIRKPVLK